MSSEGSANSSGIGFLGLLTILFIGLKLGGVIEWSWWFVLLPLYGPLACVLVILLVMAIMASFAGKSKFK